MTEAELIKGCAKHDKTCQRTFYEQFYSPMMGVCLRYSKDYAEAKTILNDGFLKVFSAIKHYRGENTLEEWIRKIIVNSAIDHLRSNKQSYWIVNTVNATMGDAGRSEKIASDSDLLSQLNEKHILKAVQALSPAYRVIFNLHFIDKYTHQQISERLDISEATSQLDFSKAKYHIRKNLTRIHERQSA